MTAAPLSAEIDSSLQRRLEAEALRTSRSVAEIAERAIESYFERADAKRGAIRESMQRADAGHFVVGAEVHAWLESWGSEAELPRPSGRGAGAAV